MFNDGKNQKVQMKMEETSRQFPIIYNRYFNNDYSDTELQEITTQPFWQSMRLTKKRLDSKGLQMNLETQEHFDKIIPQDNSVHVDEDGFNLLGSKRQTVVANKRFTLNGRTLHTVKNYEYINLYMLQGKVEGENAICPNCGHEGRLSEYIDGCDYCGSLFTVKDFETKVSGYSMEENTAQKIKKSMLKSSIWLGVLTILLMIFGVSSLGAFIAFISSGNTGIDAISSFWGFIFAADMIPVCMKCLFSLVIIFLCLRTFFVQVYSRRVSGERKIQSLIPDFSGEDFCQNLEYKLRNIHMTNDAAEVAAFASFPLNNVINKYEDVVDCCVTRCNFKDVLEQSDKYEIRVLVTMRLTLLKGRRIRTKYEKLMLALSVRKEVVHKKEIALREYKCEGCHTSINLLEGRNCKYCGAVVDYAKYGWLLDEYHIKKAPANVSSVASGILIVSYAFVFLFHILSLNQDSNDENWLSLYKEVDQMYGEWEELCESVPMPDDVDADVEQISGLNERTTVLNTYEAEDAEAVIDEYLPLLLEEEFVLEENLTEKDLYTFYREETLSGDEGYMIVIISIQDELIKVSIFGAAELPETLDEMKEKMAL